MTEYNYDKFSAGHYTLDNFQGPAAGRKAQDFTMQTTDGKSRQLLDFDGDFLVLEIGTITCPLYQSRRGVMKTLTEQYPDTSFAIMYVREAHPGIIRPKHDDIEGKRANAHALQHEDGGGAYDPDRYTRRAGPCSLWQLSERGVHNQQKPMRGLLF